MMASVARFLLLVIIGAAMSSAAVTESACKAAAACAGSGRQGSEYVCGAGNGLAAPNGVGSCAASFGGSCATSCNSTATGLVTTAAANNLNSDIGFKCGTMAQIAAAATGCSSSGARSALAIDSITLAMAVAATVACGHVYA